MTNRRQRAEKLLDDMSSALLAGVGQQLLSRERRHIFPIIEAALAEQASECVDAYEKEMATKSFAFTLETVRDAIRNA